MKTIAQYHKVLPILPLWENIERSGRVCYRSEGKTAPGTARPFTLGVLKKEHMSVMEMAPVVMTMYFPGDYSENDREQMHAVIQSYSKFLNVDRLVDTSNKEGLLISSTARGFMEMKPGFIKDAIHGFLHSHYPEIFGKPKITPQHAPVIEFFTDKQLLDISISARARHTYIMVKLVTNRAVTHEIVRHRPCSFLQESQRYCRYDKEQFGDEVTFIKPTAFFQEGAMDQEMSEEWIEWSRAMEYTEKAYFKLLKTSSPQAARTVLPNSCRTEIDILTTAEHWRHIICLRTSPGAEPSMRELITPLHAELRLLYPGMFDTLVRMPQYELEGGAPE